MARAAATRGAATAAPRRRIRKKRVSYKKLMIELIGKTYTKQLLKGETVELVVPGMSGMYSTAQVSLHPAFINFGHRGRCIHPNVSSRLIALRPRQLEETSEEWELSWMYPKLMLLLSDPPQFNRTAG